MEEEGAARGRREDEGAARGRREEEGAARGRREEEGAARGRREEAGGRTIPRDVEDDRTNLHGAEDGEGERKRLQAATRLHLNLPAQVFKRVYRDCNMGFSPCCSGKSVDVIVILNLSNHN